MTSTPIYINYFNTDSKYFKIYMSLIDRAKSRAITKKIAKELLGYVESHHIVPSSFAPEFMKDKNNICHLSAREHFIAHRLLVLISLPEFRFRAIKAVTMFSMTNDQQKRGFTSHQYNYIRKCHIETTAKNNNPRFGKPGTTLDKICVTNGTINMFVFPSDIPDGFHVGMTIPKCIQITNGKNNFRLPEGDIIPDGWWVGSMLKGVTSKLKGRIKGPPTEDTKNRIRDANSDRLWITNGVDDLKIKNGADIPAGWYEGRTNGAHTITEGMISRSFEYYNSTSVDDLINNIEKLAFMGYGYINIEKLLRADNIKFSHNDPVLKYFILKYNIMIPKEKTGPKKKSI